MNFFDKNTEGRAKDFDEISAQARRRTERPKSRHLGLLAIADQDENRFCASELAVRHMQKSAFGWFAKWRVQLE